MHLPGFFHGMESDNGAKAMHAVQAVDMKGNQPSKGQLRLLLIITLLCVVGLKRHPICVHAGLL